MKIFFILLFLSLFSCSNLSKNVVSEGDIKLKGGNYGSQNWDDTLDFKRVSWYHGLTLMFDLLYTEVDRKNPFYDWLSNAEKDTIASCDEHYIVLSYHLDPKRISRAMYLETAKKYGYERIALEDFGKHVRMHPDFEPLSLSLYTVYGLCRKKSDSSIEDLVAIQFPGFREIKMR